MPEKERQKINEPNPFGGNSSHGHPQRGEAETTKSRPGRARPAKASGSKIPVKTPRVPLKHVQSISEMTKDDTSSSEQVVTRGVENTSATKVKKVPDFRKLHSKWHKKIEKAKREKRSAIDVREFPLTPHGKFTPNKPNPRPAVNKEGEKPSIIPTSTTQSTTGSSEQLSPFKVDSASLHTILHGNGEPSSFSHRATLACGELRIPQDTYRYSMYRRRRAIPPSASMKGTTSPGMFASVSHTQGRELLTRLATTTLNSLRTVTKINHNDTSHELASIKKTLTFSAEDECGWKMDNPQTLSNLQSCSSQLNGHSTDGMRSLADYTKHRRHVLREPELVPKDQFYVLEPELCDLLKGGVAHCIGGRGQCPSPVAHLLDNVYFIPINK